MTAYQKSVEEKIKRQQSGKAGTAAYTVGLQLLEIARREPVAAELLDRDLDVAEMSLDKAAEQIKAHADKQKRVNNCVCVTPDVAEGILRKFYGLPERREQSAAPEAGGVNLADFLG